ncbi:MAG: hypothetical protein AAB403_08515 [Planctomycetota bacterium]
MHERGSRITPPAGGLPEHRSTGFVSRQSTGPPSPDWALQVVLAAMVATPHRPLLPLILEKYPGQGNDFYAKVLIPARKLIDALIEGLQEATEADPSPTLLDRLSFSWRFLQRADVLIWKLKKAEIPQNSGIQHAAAAFRNILPIPLQEPLLAALLAKLRLGGNAQYLFHYWWFRRAKACAKLPAPFGDVARTRNDDLLKTVIWWCLRARREEYVEIRPNEPVRIEFTFVVEQVLEDLKGWCGPEIEQVPDITGEVERELNEWLAYSRLEPPLEDGAPDIGLDPEIAKAFVKHNALTTKLHIHRREGDSRSDERARQLEATIRQYAEENRSLEERIRVLEASTPVTTSPPVDSGSEIGVFSELREVLKTIDSKYSFDALNAVQVGEDTHLTLRSFVSHLFYAFRKRGFSEYPKEERFTLTYEASGLYDCDGFEVPPSGNTPVKVTRKGWALNVRGRWLPVRRARVIALEAEQDQ